MRLRKQTILWILLVCVVVAVLIFLRVCIWKNALIPINDTPPDMLPTRFPIYLSGFAVKPLPLGMGI